MKQIRWVFDDQYDMAEKKKCLFRITCQKNIGRVGTIFFSSPFFSLKSCKLYYINCIFLVFSENVEKKIGFIRKSR